MILKISADNKKNMQNYPVGKEWTLADKAPTSKAGLLDNTWTSLLSYSD